MDNQIKTAYILIDFDNYFRKEIAQYGSEEIEFELSQVLLDVEKQIKNVEVIKIRLYGGWLEKGKLTKKASSVIQLIAGVNLFPIVRDLYIIHGDLELAQSLFALPTFFYNDTYKERDGISRLRIVHDKMNTICKENRNNCPPYILYNFTTSKERTCGVDNCFNKNMDVFKAAQQKMVDTLIACDIISLSAQDGMIGLFLLSDDYDHVPSLVYASTLKNRNSKIVLGLKNKNTFDEMTNILSQFPIEIKLYE